MQGYAANRIDGRGQEYPAEVGGVGQNSSRVRRSRSSGISRKGSSGVESAQLRPGSYGRRRPVVRPAVDGCCHPYGLSGDGALHLVGRLGACPSGIAGRP